MKKLIVFDLDGTLAGSKAALDDEMAARLRDLLRILRVAVISGGNWPQFETQLLANLPHDDRLKNLSLLPTCGTKFFQYEGAWKEIYSEDFTDREKEKIISSLKQSLESAGFKPGHLWGEMIEDRGSQITFSALGQQAPLEEKKSGTRISPSGQRSKQSLTLWFLSFPSAWAARHRLISPSPALTKRTVSESSGISWAFQLTR